MASFFESIFGSKAKVPVLPPIDFNQEQKNTVTGNQNALPAAQQLGREVNTFNQAELDRLYEQAAPGYDRIKNQLSENFLSLAKGEIPTDIQDSVLRGSASRAYRGGFAGSGMASNLSARDLGLTSLQLQGQGQDATQRWLQTAAAPRFDITSMFLTPAQRIPMVVQERNDQWQRSWLKSQMKALPDPVSRGVHDGVVNLLMGAGNEFGGNYKTSSPSEWARNDTPQGGPGGGNQGGGGGRPYYQPQQQAPQGGGGDAWGGYDYSGAPAGTGYNAFDDASFDASAFGGADAFGGF